MDFAFCGASSWEGLRLQPAQQACFEGSTDEIFYDKIRSQPQTWQDDILRVAEDTDSARVGNAKLASNTTEKGLKAHKRKKTYVIVGTRYSKLHLEFLESTLKNEK